MSALPRIDPAIDAAVPMPLTTPRSAVPMPRSFRSGADIANIIASPARNVRMKASVGAMRGRSKNEVNRADVIRVRPSTAFAPGSWPAFGERSAGRNAAWAIVSRSIRPPATMKHQNHEVRPASQTRTPLPTSSATRYDAMRMPESAVCWRVPSARR